MPPSLPETLWASDGASRLAAARALDEASARDAAARLGRGAPGGRWPYGMPTSLNPLVVFLGVSPGNSPSRDGEAERHHELPPTVGAAHPGLFYPDTKHYWAKVREAGAALVGALSPRTPPEDRLALVGHLNLGTGRSGSAGNAPLTPDGSEWVARLVTRGLRPRLLVGLGLNGILGQRPDLRNALRRGGLGFAATRPDRTTSMEGFRYQFRIWSGEGSEAPTVISWPNHPSRHPFAGAPGDTWRQAVHQAAALLREMGEAPRP